MPITDLLARNAAQYPNDVALVEINPQSLEDHHVTWKEYSLIERSPVDSFRSEITWEEFDRKANRLANFDDANLRRSAQRIKLNNALY